MHQKFSCAEEYKILAISSFYKGQQDTLSICRFDAVVRGRVCTQQRCVGKFRLQTLLKGCQLLVIVAAIYKLLVLRHTDITEEK